MRGRRVAVAVLMGTLFLPVVMRNAPGCSCGDPIPTEVATLMAPVLDPLMAIWAGTPVATATPRPGATPSAERGPGAGE